MNDIDRSAMPLSSPESSRSRDWHAYVLTPLLLIERLA
jgi:hypothetical protein